MIKNLFFDTFLSEIQQLGINFYIEEEDECNEDEPILLVLDDFVDCAIEVDPGLGYMNVYMVFPYYDASKSEIETGNYFEEIESDTEQYLRESIFKSFLQNNIPYMVTDWDDGCYMCPGYTAIPTNIKTLLSGDVVEWARIEFKETWDPEASLKTICAFANDIDNWGGGYLVIGVKDKQDQPDSFPGIPSEKIDGYFKDILNKCKRIQPEYMPIAEAVDYQGKHFIVVWAPGGSNRPYSSPRTMAKDCKERIYWIRKMASTIMPTEEQKKDLYDLANNVPFDDRVNHQADLEDLNLTLIQQYLREVDSGLYRESGRREFASLCRDMNLNSELPEYAKPKNVGLMFFSLEPHKFFPYAQIDVVQFPDDLGGDQIIEKTFKGPLHQQLREALQYIQNVVITERVEKLPNVAEAKRFFNYPFAAIEESLSNAVYHKGYDIREPIEVRILPDKIEIVKGHFFACVRTDKSIILPVDLDFS